jgi:predicted dehydrogenase
MMGREHLRNIALIPGSVVTAIADPHPASRAAALDFAPADPVLVDDLDRLLDADNFDALVIATPNDTHAGFLERVLAARPALPILIEKPICTTPEDVSRLRGLTAGRAAPLWVGMEYRYMPPVAAMIDAIRAGSVGTPRMIAMREHRHPFLQKVDDWNRFARRTGGTLVEKCCHFFDLMRLIAAAEAVRVYASGGADVNHKDERYGGEMPDIVDNAFVIVDFDNGMRASLDLCMFADGAWWQEDFAVTGDAGRIECLVPGLRGYERHVDAELVFSPRGGLKAPETRKVEVDAAALEAGGHHGSTYHEHLAFRRAILDGAPVEVTIEDGLRAVTIGMAAERSIREGRAIVL